MEINNKIYESTSMIYLWYVKKINKILVFEFVLIVV